MTEADKIRENRLRRMAERQGLTLQKSRRRDALAWDYETYQLRDAKTHRLVYQRGGQEYGLSLDAIETFLALNGGPLPIVDVDGDGNWPDEMLRSLGLIVVRFAALEFCAERLLYGFVSDSDLGILVVAGQDMSWKLDRLRAIHNELEPSEAADALRDWIDGAKELNDRRNLLVHSVWSMGPNGLPVGYRPRGRGKWKLEGLEVTPEQLVELAADVSEGTATAVGISNALSGHPQWKGRPADQAAPQEPAEN
jgi:hypothetical protein